MDNQRFSLREILSRKEPQIAIKGTRITSSVIWNLLLLLISLLFVTAFFVGGAAAGYFASLVQDEPIPDSEELEENIYNYEEATEIYFAGGEYLGDMPSPIERREAELDEISENLINAVIATEDEYFFEHDGIVPKAILRALYQDFSNAATQTGGSTLTQQLVKNQLLSSEVTHDRKAVEILYAMRTEHFFEKEDILEAYLNVVPFGRNANGQQIAGVRAAAEGIFDEDVSDLNIAQAAFIAGLPQSPFGYTPFEGSGEVRENFDAGLDRMETVIERMHRFGAITDEEKEDALAYDIRENLTEPEPTSLDEYPFLTDEVRRRALQELPEILMDNDDVDLDDIEDDDQRNLVRNRYEEEAERALSQEGYEIHLTIDKDIYDAQQEAVEEFEMFSDQTDYVTNDDGEEEETTILEETASVTINNETGQIISFVGGRDFETQNYNRATQAFRQSGSTMKPLTTYALSFETGYLQPGILAPDTPYEDYNDGEGLTNFDNQYDGLMTSREALARSRNVPAVREFMPILDGEREFAEDALIDYGFSRFIENDPHPYASTPLGTLGLTVEANASAFTAVANMGERVDSFMIESINDSDGETIYEEETEGIEVFSPQTGYLVLDTMRDVIYDDVGTASTQITNTLNFDSDFAGKTGTTQEFRDSWFVGLNPNITQATWLGFDDNRQLAQNYQGMGYSGRTQMLWAELMNAAYEEDDELIGPDEEFESPGGIVEEEVCTISGMLPSDLCEEAGLVETDIFNSDYAPTEEDDSLQEVDYVEVGGNSYTALDETPSEFTRSGVSVDEEYFDFAEDEDISEYIPEDWDDLVSDEEAPDNGSTPSSLNSVTTSGNGIAWDEHPDEQVIGYRVYYASSEDGSYEEVDAVRWDEDFNYSGGEGSYAVTAVDTAGRESDRNETMVGSFEDDDEDDNNDDSAEDNSENSDASSDNNAGTSNNNEDSSDNNETNDENNGNNNNNEANNNENENNVSNNQNNDNDEAENDNQTNNNADESNNEENSNNNENTDNTNNANNTNNTNNTNSNENENNNNSNNNAEANREEEEEENSNNNANEENEN
ncbi:transglycosylase domain-containing protein [Salisediminibacterium halotolerans]|uniref:transglycosylase domain-containing protein n=1 Tax=Salisediminibacterium halotolerans TaxID=517425 RepID=UPI000EB58DA2|nr:transglycosylase domain-containing protein [Salisediminibacterium halotolerans]RLJ69382.1 penicillin-binding protein [Actinophytocola xinjiangensis]RPE83992.1 penicillin-binding protein [Salisediminibacterium halotolerans]TWG32457.1 penicillin-binding protein [Salisediminibacterium halotolerans]GEL08066.1 hypothetical protein SHA02_14820 [Salisediminibacterium halotolerans]